MEIILLNIWMDLYINWYFCRDQIKYININTPYGTFTKINSFEDLLRAVKCKETYFKSLVK